MNSANMSVRTFMEEPKLIANPMDRIADIIGKMRETNYWSVPVVQGGKLVGVVDYKTLMAKRFGPDTKVLTVMVPTPKLESTADEARVIAAFFNTRARAIPVVDERNRLVGIVTREAVLKHYLDRGEIPSRPVREFMNSPVLTVNAQDSVARARYLMRSYNVSRLPVMDKESLAGIVTMRDLALRLLFSYKGKKRASIMTEEEKLMAMPVSEIMTYPVITAKGSDPLDEAASRMLSRKVSGLPVLEGDRVAGMISGIDVIVKVLAKKFELSSPISAKLARGITGDQRALMDGLLERYMAKFERMVEVIDFKVSVKEEASSEGKPLYKVNLRLVTKIGDFAATESDYDPVTATRKAAEDLEERLLRKLKKIEEMKKTRGDVAKRGE
jgi:CBS-domain-containing membrane protein